MRYVVLCVIALSLMSCERSISETKELDPIGNGYYLKEIVISTDMTYRYIYFLVDKDGTPIQGTSANYLSGKVNQTTATVIVPDDAEYRYYKKLKEKYEDINVKE
jgi:hypothetical protein